MRGAVEVKTFQVSSWRELIGLLRIALCSVNQGYVETCQV
jgi:hypothetical protein